LQGPLEGGVSGRPMRKHEKSNLLLSPRRNGGRHPVFGKSSPFAGWRWNEGLGRSSGRVKDSSFVRSMHRRQGVSRDSRAGERRPRAESESEATRTLARPKRRREDASLFSVHGPVHVTHELIDIAVGQTRDIGRNRHRGQSGRTQRGSPLVIRSREERPHDGSEKEDGLRRRPCEETRVVDEVPVRRSSCRNRQAVPDLE
jgi:hypothetical protein